MKRIFTHLFAAVLLMFSATSWAQLSSLEVGQIYRFKSARADRSLRADGVDDVHTKTTDLNDKAQEWYVTKDGDYYVLRNVACGKYLKGALTYYEDWTMTDDYSATENKFQLLVSNSTLNTLKTKDSNGYGHMHDNDYGDNGGYNVVGWLNGNDNTGSHWTITKVNYTAEQIKALLDAAPTKAETAAYGVALAALFKDGACTELKDEYTSMSVEDIKADANYKALPAVLQNTVLKIKNDSWGEDNADATKQANNLNWDAEYAKKFRVQMYEPYSIAGDITGFLRMNAHSNNDNPTGVYMPRAGYVYVMVEGEIKSGATLRLHCAGSNSRIINPTGAGYELNSGLNIINIASVANGGDHLYVCYNVDTYNPNGTDVDEKFPHKLSEYPPLKIHIEGGAINGFYNACGDFLAGKTYDGVTYNSDLWKEFTGASVDCDDDWKYMEERANLGVLPILGHRQILLFQLHDENGQKGMEYYLPENINVPEKPYCYPKTTEWNDYGMGCDSETGKINIFMESWDRIMYSELATLGLVSKDDMDKMNKRYPRWNADGTMGEIYDFENVGPDGKTYQEFCRGLDYSEYFNHHGVSLGGTTGYMSAGWYEANYNNNTFGELMNLPNNSGNIWGPCHEIGHQFQDVFNIRGGTEVTNNVFSNAAIWYQGIATSRYNGGGLSTTLANFNSGLPFIDYNIWSMTQMFYKLWLYYHLAANNTQFYPRFFEMLRIDPLSAKGSIATGTESMLKIYEKMCDASGEDLTEFFRAHGFFVLLDSYPKEDYGITVFVQTQDEVDAAIARVKAKGYKPNYAALLINDMEVTATVRHDGETPRNHYDGPGAEKSEFGSVNDFITGNVATSAYTATVNSDGSITMSGGEGGVGFLVLDKNGKLLSFADKSTFALSEEAKLAVITGKASVVSINSDNSTPVEAVIDLTAMKQTLLADLIADVETVVANVDDTYKNVGCYKPAAVDNLKTLLDEAKDVYASGTAYEGAYEMLYAEYRKVIDNPNSLIGIISGKKYAIKNRGGNDYMTVSGTNVVTTGNSTLPTTDDNLWTIETSGENYHIKHAGTGMYLQGVSNENDVPYTVGNTAVNYMMTRIENAYYALSTVEHFARYMNRHGNKTVATWNTTDANSQWAITLVEDVQDVGDIANLELLVSKTRNLLDKVADVDYTGDAYPLQADDSSADFFITSNATEGGHEPKYLLDGATATFFHTVWAGSSPGAAHYLQIDLGEGNEIDQFVFSYSTIGQTNVDAPEVIEVKGSNSSNSDFQSIATLSGSLPTTHLTPYTSDVLGSTGTKYRYLRFTVTDATGGTLGGYYYFGISELAIKRINYKFNNLHSGYASVDENVVITAIEQYEAAKQVMANSSGYDEALSSLQTAYNNLVIESCKILTDKLQSLKTVTDETAALIAQVGSVTKPMSGTLALQANNASEAYYISTNADQNTGGGKVDGGGIAALVDNSEGTHFHSRWGGTSVNEPHYIQVDLGTEVDANFQFSYVAHDSPDATTIVVSSSKDGVAFTDIETVTKNLTAVGAKYVSKVFEPQDSYRYLRFAVTSSNGRGYGNKFGDYYCFGMKEFDLELFADLIFTLNSQYSEVGIEELFKSTYFKTEASNNIYKTGTASIEAGSPLVTIEMLEAQIADQQAAKAALQAAMESITIDKTALQSLYDEALALYGEMADGEGYVNSYYEPSALTNEKLAEAKTALDAAETVLDSSNSQSEIDDAKTALQAQYDALLEIKNSDVTGRDELNALIGDMQSLLGEVADKTTAKTAIALQTTDANAEFYIWSNAKASDCDGVGASALIDKNNDGTANTGTFFGTVWQGGAVPNYSHYITVDLGTEIALNELSLDYTTRNSTHSNQRPTAIKVLGSNDKEGEYAEITTLSEGMPVGQNQKWEMTSTVALDNYYRYIRFAPATEMGFFNMSDFNLYAHSAVKANDNYSTSDITTAQLFAMNAALLASIDARDNYVTEENYNTALAALQTQYNALLEIKDANVTDRTSLTDLITETNTLVAEVAQIDETEAKIALQCDDENAPYYIYCNAPGATNNYDGDNLGVAALLDYDDGGQPLNSTHLHTTYTGNSYDDEFDHYLRVDMGENSALEVFKFAYIPRSGNTNNSPKVMLIEGSNDCVNFEEIATLTDMQPIYQSDVITNGKAYRYIRFMVKETHNNDKYNGHPYFVLSHFEMTACKTIEVAESFASPNLPLSTVVAASNELVYGTTVNEQFYVTETVYNTAVAELQAAKNALEAAIALKDIPVKLTTDAANPVLYKIQIKSNEKVFTYDCEGDEPSMNPVLATEEFGNKYQAWYFMKGNDNNSNDDIFILPYFHQGEQNTTHKLGYPNINGSTKPAVSETGASSYNWYITFTKDKTTEGWWNLQPQGGTSDNTYVNQQGGSGSTILSFWKSASNPNDNGSQFQFVLDETDYSLPESYFALYNQFENSAAEVACGTKIGTYTQESVDRYNQAYANASQLLEEKKATAQEYSDALAALVDALEYNGGLCRIRSAYTGGGGYSSNKLAYVDAENKPYFEAATDENLSKYVWEFVPVQGGYHLKSLHTQSYVTAAGWGGQVVLGDEVAAKLVTVDFLDDENSIVRLNVAGGYPLHAQNTGSKLVGYSGGLNSASAWYIEEVENVATIKHTVTMNATFSSVMLGYNATVPAGVEAYNAEGVEDGYVTLVELEGGVIPANTPVILYRTDDNTSKTFTYTTTVANTPTETVLGGSLYQKYVECDDEKDYYKLMINKEGEAKMYWMYKEFNAEGNYGENDVLKGTDNGGHIKCSANKIYMALPQSQAAASFGMRFIDGGATGLNGTLGENGEPETIYDLTGRKVVDTAVPGVYIVNGKKVLVK